MSQFEYVSVALALLYSFAVARLLAALPSVTARGRRYWIHTGQVFVVLLAAAATWWTVWALRDVEWNGLRFAWILSVPALIHARASVLVSEEPADVGSWLDHYYEKRVPFFGIGLAIAVNGAVIPWVMGIVPWLSIGRAHVVTLLLGAICVVGLSTARPRVHGALVIVNVLMLGLMLSFLGSPAATPAP